MEKILFVCLGNICRSPMAEGLFQKYAQESKLPLLVDSAATSTYNSGQAPHLGTQKIFDREGITARHMQARQIQAKDFETFDWIIGMDQQNLVDLRRLAPNSGQQKLHLYMEVVPGKSRMEVPDPWYTGDFEETYQLLMEGLPYWIDEFRCK